MFKDTLKLIKTLFKYAPVLTILKLLQSIAEAVLSPLSIYFTQKLIDTAIKDVKLGVLNNNIFRWGLFLLLSLFFSSIGKGFLSGVLHISLKHKLNLVMTPDILDKLRKIDYACFEDKEVHNTLSRMTSDPQDNVLNLFINICDTFSSFISMAGTLLIFMQAGWWFAVGFLILFTPTTWLDFKVEDMLEELYDSQSTDERRMKYLGSLLSSKQALFELRVFNSVDYILKKWKSLSKIVLDERLKKNLNAQKYAILSTLLY